MSNPSLTNVSPSTLKVAALLETLVTNAVDAVDTSPPPQVLVRYQHRAIMFSRHSLEQHVVLGIFQAFTVAFDLASTPDNGPLTKVFDKKRHEFFEYVPMKLYVTFLRGHGAAEKKAYEASAWDAGWRGLVPNIDEVHILTMPEFHERIKNDKQRHEKAHKSEQGGDPTPAVETEGKDAGTEKWELP